MPGAVFGTLSAFLEVARGLRRLLSGGQRTSRGIGPSDPTGPVGVSPELVKGPGEDVVEDSVLCALPSCWSVCQSQLEPGA